MYYKKKTIFTTVLLEYYNIIDNQDSRSFVSYYWRNGCFAS